MSYFGADLLNSSTTAPNHEHKLSIEEIDKLLRERKDVLYGGLPLYVSGLVPRNTIIVMSPDAFEQMRPPKLKFEWHDEARTMPYTFSHTLPPRMTSSPFWTLAIDSEPVVVKNLTAQTWIAYLILFLAIVVLVLYGGAL